MSKLLYGEKRQRRSNASLVGSGQKKSASGKQPLLPISLSPSTQLRSLRATMPGRKRAESVSITVDDRNKRLKTEHGAAKAVNHVSSFADGLFNEKNVQDLEKVYKDSGPFLHVVVDKLLQNDLLSKVKDECLGELSFSEKETDIYKVRNLTLFLPSYLLTLVFAFKVHQTGDLASLSYLAEAQIALLPNLLKLRDALYSDEFRSFIRKVTGCGPLSGKKQDMSVNSYRKGCHLLNHDDVIGKF